MSMQSPSYPAHAGPLSVSYAQMQDEHPNALGEPVDSDLFSTARVKSSFRESHYFFSMNIHSITKPRFPGLLSGDK